MKEMSGLYHNCTIKEKTTLCAWKEKTTPPISYLEKTYFKKLSWWPRKEM